MKFENILKGLLTTLLGFAGSVNWWLIDSSVLNSGSNNNFVLTTTNPPNAITAPTNTAIQLGTTNNSNATQGDGQIITYTVETAL